MKQEWFERWFGEQYKALYPHRNQAQARDQVKALMEACSASPSWNILDVGCGSGRHLQSLLETGFQKSHGIDLSPFLLHDAISAGLSVARADMRHLPFPAATFHLLTSFFTSFGYFATRDEDRSTLLEFCRVVKPDGFVFLDLPNPEWVMQSLVHRDTLKVGNETIDVERFLEGDQVVKRIRCEDSGDVYEERVRLYSLSDLKPMLPDLNLTLLRLFGDEHGGVFSPDISPRMGLLLRRH